MRERRSLLVPVLLVLGAIAAGVGAGMILYSFWDLPEVRALEEYKPSITSRVFSADNELLAEFFTENRTPILLSEVPETFLQALIATEDNRFYSHPGVDLRGIARALYRNIRAGTVLEGGSTLTQQLAKILFLTPEKSYVRKLKEMVLALRIEQRYTKQEILTLYCNQIYFGSGAYGVEAAAQTYFGKHAKDLLLVESALLAGIPRSPRSYSPFREPERALGRRSYVLNRMAHLGFISSQEAEDSKKIPLPAPRPVVTGGPAPYFVEYVRQRVEERFGSSILYSGGLSIYTSIDRGMQVRAEEALRSGLQKIESRLGRKKRPAGAQPLQGAIIAMEPVTGRIRAMVGGRDFRESQFNRAWQAYRQPGSAFKPILYAAALERGYGPAEMLDDSPLAITINRSTVWKPENFTRTYGGPVTLRKALAHSLNVPSVRLLQKVGLAQTIRFAQRLGIRSQLASVPSLALGSSDLTLLELTSAYAVFAGQGVRAEPNSIMMVSDSTGRALYVNDAATEQVMREETAYLATSLLRGVIEHGTGWKARALGRPAAGKTGTTNDYHDAWFIGYVPNLVAGVWIGYDDHRSIGPRETGSQTALPIWVDFMKRALQEHDPEEFIVPSGLVFRQIDPRSGLLSTEQCPASIREAFLPGTEPRQYCTEAAPVIEEPAAPDEAPE